MQRIENHWLTRVAFLSLSIVLVAGLSSPSWAGTVSAEQCQEAVARSSTPMPPFCTVRHIRKIDIHTDEQGQPTCWVERVQYECQRSPNSGMSLDGRDEFFLIPATGDVFNSNSGDGPENKIPSQAGPVPSERPWLDQALFPDAGAKNSKKNPPIPFNPYSRGQKYKNPVGQSAGSLPDLAKNKSYKGKGWQIPILAPNPPSRFSRGQLQVKLANGQWVPGWQRKDGKWMVSVGKDKQGKDIWVLAGGQDVMR